MVTYRGVTCTLTIERLTAEGMIDKEYLGELDGSGTDQTFYTKRFPITTGAGVATDSESDVNVYTDDKSPGSWSEYLDDGSDFEITGATGAVVIKSAENQSGNAGEKVSIDYYTTVDVGEGGGITIDFDGSLENIHKLGSRDPQEIKEGPKTISGRIDWMFISRDLMGTFLTESDFYKKLADFTVTLYPNGNTAGQPYIKLSNVKFGGGSLSVDVNSILAGNMTFQGLAIEVGTV